MERIEGAVKAIGESQAGSAPKKETDRLWGVLWTIAGFLIIMLLGVIGFLLTHPGWPEPRQAQAVQVQTTVK